MPPLVISHFQTPRRYALCAILIKDSSILKHSPTNFPFIPVVPMNVRFFIIHSAAKGTSPTFRFDPIFVTLERT